MIYLELPYVTIQWDESIACVAMKWKGFIPGEDFQNGLNKGVELLAAKQGRKWLSDLSEMAVISQENQAWTDENWFPQAAATGLRFIAVVKPRKVIPQMSLQNIINHVGNADVATAFFDTPEEAWQWLAAR
ncbi:MAG: STAS/SEC14 domain-containing protein [Firmicutes bacterium]|nr:STAS/SEC14 domain-containing protein [Bacillota bacterium]